MTAAETLSPVKPESAEPRVGVALMAALLILTCGHVLSNMLRTTPALAIDVMAPDLGVTPQTLAALTSAYHFFFALLQIPIGVALDRYSIRSVSLTLFAGTIAGAAIAAFSTGPLSFFVSQATIGMATSGMLMCPITLAAKRLTPAQFGLWSGVILSFGNSGLLLSASPLAYIVEHWGWRAGYWTAAGAAVVVAGLIAVIVPVARPDGQQRALGAEMASVLRLGLSRALRGIIILAFVSLAMQLVLRGLWAGPWLMSIKGLSRIEAGNVLLLFTLALVVAPAMSGVIDRKFGHRRVLLLGVHLVAAVLLLTMALGAPGYPLARLLGISLVPVAVDTVLLVTFGFLVSMQPLIYAMIRQAVAPENIGKALSAANLAFFLGTAVMQSITSPIAAYFGLPAVLIVMAVCLTVGALTFFALTGPAVQRAKL
ncbi:MAG: MFS transporter [Bradyrhizobiaceae bacterium PARB1]|jgi:predicted MFS family arabinose efflux permease|nr:MAG: MFS transporter [Bradyrhizobiaceae bacterium PARB1]